MASYTFACFLAPKPDLWTASEEPPGTMSSLHNIWLVFQWSKPTHRYESNADENMFSTVNQQAFGGEEGLLVGWGWGWGGVQRGSEWLREGILWFADGEIQTESSYFVLSTGIGFKQIHITCADLSSLLCFKVIVQHRHWRRRKKRALVAPTVDSIHRLPVLHPVSGWMSGFCAAEDKSQGRILTRSVHHTLSRASKQGEHRWQETARTSLGWGLHETSGKT